MGAMGKAERNSAQNIAGTGREKFGRGGNLHFAVGLARAFGAAIVFSLPLLMTMEMWWLGFYMSPSRLALLLLLVVPLLVGLSHFAGFEETFRWKDDLLNAFVAYAVGFLASAPVLLLFGTISPGMTAREIVGKISLQAVPGSIGALLAQSQLGGKKEKEDQERKKQRARYGGEIFLMAVGALFLAFSVSPTQEMVLIAYKMTEWHAVGLAAVSLILMHAFVYSVEFHGQASTPPGTPLWNIFLRFTVVGYAVALLISLYVLWTFGRTAGMSTESIVMAMIVLGFPAAVGAAAARLIL